MQLHFTTTTRRRLFHYFRARVEEKYNSGWGWTASFPRNQDVYLQGNSKLLLYKFLNCWWWLVNLKVTVYWTNANLLKEWTVELQIVWVLRRQIKLLTFQIFAQCKYAWCIGIEHHIMLFIEDVSALVECVIIFMVWQFVWPVIIKSTIRTSNLIYFNLIWSAFLTTHINKCL